MKIENVSFFFYFYIFMYSQPYGYILLIDSTLMHGKEDWAIWVI